MRQDKKLLVIHLNEFNFDHLKYGAKKYNLKYLKEIIKYKKISTFTKDKIQNKNLDPWVQSVSINSGQPSSKHKVYKLGQKLSLNLLNIWDILTKEKINCSVWGPMNSAYKKNKFLQLFFPDPWNYRVTPHPTKLKYIHYLPKYYAKNYLNVELPKMIKFSLYFLFGLLKNNLFFFLLKNIDLIIKSFFLKRIKNFTLFCLFDLISIFIFTKNIKYKKKQFSFIFLNSLAHYQHNNWNEKNNEKLYFIYVDRICEYINILYKKHDSLIIFNGFKQKKIKTEYLLRPINPKNFLSKIIQFDKLEQDMTNGGYIFFNKFINTKKAFNLLKNYTVCGFYIFQVSQKKKNSFFYRINIKSLENIKLKKNRNMIKNLSKIFRYDTIIKNNFIKNTSNNDEEIMNFLEDIYFIKTTGIHTHQGDLLYENIDIKNKDKNIINHKIFGYIKNYFLKKKYESNFFTSTSR